MQQVQRSCPPPQKIKAKETTPAWTLVLPQAHNLGAHL